MGAGRTQIPGVLKFSGPPVRVGLGGICLVGAGGTPAVRNRRHALANKLRFRKRYTGGAASGAPTGEKAMQLRPLRPRERCSAALSCVLEDTLAFKVEAQK
jgi:hypothetical protein